MKTCTIHIKMKGNVTHCSKFYWGQVWNEGLWVDCVQVPGEVLALQPLSQIKTIRNVPIVVL